MKLGRVVGTVVSTINTPVFEGRRLLVCDILDEHGEPTGGYSIAVDTVDAGAGETVLILDEGNSARQVLHREPDGEVRAVVVGIVDAVTVGGREVPKLHASGAGPRRALTAQADE